MRDETTETTETARAVLNVPVFFGSAAIILAFALFAMAAPDTAETAFSAMQDWVLGTFGWFYMLSVAVFLIFAVALALSPLGEIKLGPDHSKPDYSYWSWFAMLFSAGMGIGLMFFGVAEPVLHYANPPIGEGQTVEAARRAMVYTFFHWGFHAWAIYAVIGLALAFFSFRHGLPLTIRSALYPLIGERIHGPIGHMVDIFAVVGTLLGVATSLGLGVMQINAGLGALFGVGDNIGVQIVLIAIITGLATLSVVAGLDAGIRRLSELNIFLAVLLLGFVIVAGPTVLIFNAMSQNIGMYLSDVVGRTFQLYAYEPNEWLGTWTLFYWAWWIAWSPFVGMFIARVSRGRTIREFVGGVLAVPFLVTAIWFSAFGNTALDLDLTGATSSIVDAANEDSALALFALLAELPLSGITSLIATLLVVTFFVTSSDSGSLVIDTITAGGREDAPTWQRVFWALTEGVVAAALLLAGGLSALQTASLIGALPFTVVMLFVCYGLYQGLQLERARMRGTRMAARSPVWAQPMHWKLRLSSLLDYPPRQRVDAFLRETVEPALNEVAAELREKGAEAQVETGEHSVVLRTGIGNGEGGNGESATAFEYGVYARGYYVPDFALRDLPHSTDEKRRYYKAEVHLREGGKDYDVMDYTKDQVITDVLTQYERHLHVLHLTAA